MSEIILSDPPVLKAPKEAPKYIEDLPDGAPKVRLCRDILRENSPLYVGTLKSPFPDKPFHEAFPRGTRLLHSITLHHGVRGIFYDGGAAEWEISSSVNNPGQLGGVRFSISTWIRDEGLNGFAFCAEGGGRWKFQMSSQIQYSSSNRVEFLHFEMENRRKNVGLEPDYYHRIWVAWKFDNKPPKKPVET